MSIATHFIISIKIWTLAQLLPCAFSTAINLLDASILLAFTCLFQILAHGCCFYSILAAILVGNNMIFILTYCFDRCMQHLLKQNHEINSVVTETQEKLGKFISISWESGKLLHGVIPWKITVILCWCYLLANPKSNIK